jgi:hypothetical protein
LDGVEIIENHQDLPTIFTLFGTGEVHLDQTRSEQTFEYECRCRLHHRGCLA